MKEYFTEIILPYVNKKRRILKLSSEQPALLIFDNFKAQCTPSFLTLFDANKINGVMILPNCTDRLQPLDLSDNKAAKDFHLVNSENGMQNKFARNLMDKMQ